MNLHLLKKCKITKSLDNKVDNFIFLDLKLTPISFDFKKKN
jgi:hypothetical protein